MGSKWRGRHALRRADEAKLSLYHGIEAIIYAKLGMTAEATQAGEQFQKMNPRFLENLSTELLRRNLRPADRAHVIEGLRLAGVPVPNFPFTAPRGRRCPIVFSRRRTLGEYNRASPYGSLTLRILP